ncbi:MAG: glycosyltransferase [Chloroflexi bacterium]|nr:glycosyltransferase [Chloroflexota bacterium]
MNRPISVYLLTGEFPPAVGGIADYTALLAEQLQSMGARVQVVAMAEGRSTVVSSSSAGDSVGETAGVPVRYVRDWGPGTLFRLARDLRREAADIVHLQYQAAGFFRSPLISLLPWLLRTAGVRARFVTTFHDLRVPFLFPKAGPLRRLAVSAIWHSSRGVVCTDPADILAMARKGPSAWIPIGPNIVPDGRGSRSEARARWGLSDDATVIGFFGFINASKGVDDLLDATARLVDEGWGHLHLLFVGDEVGASDPTNLRTLAAIRAKIEGLGLANRITWTGALANADVSQALEGADLAVLPYVDGASLRRGSLMACLAHGLPIVTTWPHSQPDLPDRFTVPPFDEGERFRLSDGAVAFAEPGNAASLAAVMATLLDNPARREELSCGGRALAERFNWPAIGAATLRFYERVLGS